MLGHYLPFSIKLKFLSELITQQRTILQAKFWIRLNHITNKSFSSEKFGTQKILQVVVDNDFGTWLNDEKN